MRHQGKPKVGLLGLTLEFYEQLAPQLRADRERFVRERLIPALADHAEVTFDGAVFTREAVEKTINGFEADGVDLILVVLLAYSPSLIVGPALKRTHLPIAVWNTQELYAVDEHYGDAELLANHGVHGTQDLCNVLLRESVPFQYVTSHLNDERPLGGLPEIMAAAGAVGRLRRARVGLLGYPFPGMGDFGLDTTWLANSLGCICQGLSMGDYFRRESNCDDAQVNKYIEEYKAVYELADKLDADDLAATARAEIALRGLIDDHRLDAISYQFLAFGEDDRSETLPFVAASRLLADGVGFGGEGDVISAVYSALVNRLQPPGGFSEIFTIDFAGNALLLSHMGESNVAMARQDRPVRMVRRPAPIVPIRRRQLALVCSYEPGPATLSTLTLSADQRWRIIASPVTVEDFGPLDHLAVPHSKVCPVGDVRDFLNGYALAGGPHHLALCFGDARRKLKLAAYYLGAEYVEV